MVKIISVVLLSLTMFGCVNNPPVVDVQIVKVPVYQCPTNHSSINRGERPILIIESLTKNDLKDPGKVAQAYKASIKQLQNYAGNLEIGFDGYRNMCVKASSNINDTLEVDKP